MEELKNIKAKLYTALLNTFASTLAKKRRVLVSYNFKSQRDSFDFVNRVKV